MKNSLFKFLLNYEVSYILLCKIFFRKYNFKKINKVEIDASWGILTCFIKLDIPLEQLTVLLNSPNGYLPISIEESPHYKFITKFSELGQIDADEYIAYFNNYNEHAIEDQQINKFINLYESIKKDPSKLYVCIKRESDSFFTNKFKILDGLHRVAIAKTLNIYRVECFIVDEIN